MILYESHEGIAGGNHVEKETMQTLLRIGFWWPPIFQDAKEYCKCCGIFQRIGKPCR